MASVVEDRTSAGLSAGFTQFAETVFANNTPLCRALSLGVAQNAELLALAARTRVGQYPPYVLISSAHYVLLEDDSEPLAEYFPTLRKEPLPPEGVFPVFLDFCRRREAELTELVSTGLVQINEVNRCACLAPALAYVASIAGDAPLHLIDIGAAAGLNLLFDRYLLDYGRFAWGDPSSSVQLSCELVGDTDPPLAGWTPKIGHRVGVDLNPIDLTDAQQSRWLRALVWPDLPDRATALNRAMALARKNPPTVLEGDAVTLLPELLAGVSEGETPCLLCFYALEYFPEESRARFRQILDEFGAVRDVYQVEMSGVGERAGLRLSSWRSGTYEQVQLAQCQPHGQSLRWLV